MLEQFDTVLAFVAVLTGVSLIITTLTQMVSGFLALRGRHLRRGLAGLLRNYASDVRPYADALSRHLLDHPLISDSMLSQKIWVPRKWYSAAAHFFVSGWKYATAVRPGELRAIILSLTEGLDGAKHLVDQGMEVIGRTDSPPGGRYGELLALVKQVRQHDGLATYWLNTAEKLEHAAQAADPHDEKARQKIEALLSDFFQALAGTPLLAARLDSATGAGLASPLEAADWDRWFNGTMDRVSQHFATHTRWWTIAFAMIIAFALPLDLVDLYRRLSTEPELRARIIAGSEALAARAEELNPDVAPSTALIYGTAWRQLTNAHPQTLALLPRPPRLTNFDGATRWITNELALLSAADRLPAHADRSALTNAVKIRAWLGEYEALIPQARLRASAERLQALVEEQGHILPSRPESRALRHWPGILAAAALLSLGAPFWFNALRKMSSLRPLVANKQDEEKPKPTQAT